MVIGFLDSLKRARDIFIKAMSSGGEMAFRCNSPFRSVEVSIGFDKVEKNVWDSFKGFYAEENGLFWVIFSAIREV